MTDSPRLSIVLPCYNEAPGLGALLERYAFAGHEIPFELILVDNGSTDDTPLLLPKLLPRFSFARSVRVEQNQGYGHGILTGLAAAQGETLAWSHADLQTDPADLFRAWHVYQQSGHPERTFVKGRRQGRDRTQRIISWGMQTVATLLLRTRLNEINAQPKLFHRELLSCLADPPQDLNLDLYVLYAAKSCGWQIREISVEFPPRIHGESSWATSWRSKFRTIWRSFRYIAKLSTKRFPRSAPSIAPSPFPRRAAA